MHNCYSTAFLKIFLFLIQRLAEVAHSLLKVSPYDPLTMGCRGLQRYMNEILPHPDWSHEDLRPALVNILRRLDKMFNKIAKKSSIRVRTVILYSHLDIGIVFMVFLVLENIMRCLES